MNVTEALEMASWVELMEEVRRRQLGLCEQRADETPEEFDARVAVETPVQDEWIGSLCCQGNSVSWIYSKAKRYKDDLGKAWDALTSIGVRSDGQTHIADAIRQQAIRKP